MLPDVTMETTTGNPARVRPSRLFDSYENTGYSRLQLASEYHSVMHDISMSTFTPQEAAAWDMVIGMLEKRRDNLVMLGHREILNNIQLKARK